MATSKKVAKKVVKKATPRTSLKATQGRAKKKATIKAKRMVVSSVPTNLPGVYRPGRKVDGIFGHPRFVPVFAIALFGVTISSIFGVLGSSAAPINNNCFIQQDGVYQFVDSNGQLTDKVISMYDKTPNVQDLLCEF